MPQMEGGQHGRMIINHAQEVVAGAFNLDNVIAQLQGESFCGNTLS